MVHGCNSFIFAYYLNIILQYKNFNSISKLPSHWRALQSRFLLPMPRGHLSPLTICLWLCNAVVCLSLFFSLRGSQCPLPCNRRRRWTELWVRPTLLRSYLGPEGLIKLEVLVILVFVVSQSGSFCYPCNDLFWSVFILN